MSPVRANGTGRLGIVILSLVILLPGAGAPARAQTAADCLGLAGQQVAIASPLSPEGDHSRTPASEGTAPGPSEECESCHRERGVSERPLTAAESHLARAQDQASPEVREIPFVRDAGHSAPATIRHTPTATWTEGRDLPLEAEAAGGRRLVVQFRNSWDPRYGQTRMEEIESGRYRAVIPSSSVAHGQVKYYVVEEVSPGRMIPVSGEPRRPHVVALLQPPDTAFRIGAGTAAALSGLIFGGAGIGVASAAAARRRRQREIWWRRRLARLPGLRGEDLSGEVTRVTAEAVALFPRDGIRRAEVLERLRAARDLRSAPSRGSAGGGRRRRS